ncbi:hypothetical protein X777_12681, partial [Ooceraea biroi]
RDGSGSGDLGNRGGVRGVCYGGGVRGVCHGGGVRGVCHGGGMRGVGEGGSDGWRGELSNGSGVGEGSGGDRGGIFGNGGGIGERRSVRHGGGDLGYGGGVGERSSVRNGCGVGEGSSVRNGGGDLGNGGSIGEGCGVRNVSDGGGDGLDGDSSGFLADYGVESVDRVSGVVDNAPGTVGLQERVAALDEVAIAGLLLALGVAGQAVVHIIGIAVLGMRVVVGVHGLSHHGFGDGSGVGQRGGGCRGVGQRDARCENTGVGDGHEGGKSDELKRSTDKFLFYFTIQFLSRQII